MDAPSAPPDTTLRLPQSWLNTGRDGEAYWPTAADYLTELRARVGEYERKARRQQRLTFDEARDLRRLLACLADLEAGREGLSTADRTILEDAGGRLRQALADLAKLEGLDVAPLLGEVRQRYSPAWCGLMRLDLSKWDEYGARGMFLDVTEAAHYFTAKARSGARLTPAEVDRLHGVVKSRFAFRAQLEDPDPIEYREDYFVWRILRLEFEAAYRRIGRVLPILSMRYALCPGGEWASGVDMWSYRGPDPLGEPWRDVYWEGFWYEFRRQVEEIATAPPDVNTNNGEQMADTELLQLCGLPADAPEDVVELVRLAATLLERGNHHSKERNAAAALLVAAMGRAGRWNVQSLPFGYEGPRVEHEGWIKRPDVELTLTQIGGLIAGSNFDDIQSAYAVSQAVQAHWLREERYDAWRPGMKSGSGWTTVLQTQPLGLVRARELAIASPKPLASTLRSWQAPSPPPAPVPDAKPEADEESDVGGPTEDPHDNRVAWWAGKRIYLGNDTEVSRLFWLLAKPVGAAANLAQVQRAIDGMETPRDMRPDDVRKAAQRLRKVISKLRAALREPGLDDHVLIVKDGPQAEPQYSMVPRFGK